MLTYNIVRPNEYILQIQGSLCPKFVKLGVLNKLGRDIPQSK
ncbi:MAG: hypothetical protein ABSB40_08280 [Nitrososphaeria archaeon]